MRTPHASLLGRTLSEVSTLALALAFFGMGSVALNATAATASPIRGYTCSGGSPSSPTPIPAGSYGALTVTGFCFVAGTAEVRGGLTIAPDAVLFAADSPDCAQISHLDVSGGIRVQSNGVLFLGDSNTRPDGGTGCPTSNDVVNGGIAGSGANSVVIHGTTINGGFSLNGGGGGNSYAQGFCGDAVVGGMDAGFPPFSDVEDSQVNGGASIVGLSTCWMGFISNQVDGGVTINNNTLGDPDAIEVGLNVIHGGLACSGNMRDPQSHIDPDNGTGGVPTNSFDGSPANPNSVTGPETGQCTGL